MYGLCFQKNLLPEQVLRWGHDYPRDAEEGKSLRASPGREVGEAGGFGDFRGLEV